MTCKEAEKAVPLFFKKELEDKELKKFIKHIKKCPNCREELSIYYLATEGIVRLEEGSSFDLEKELDIKLEEAVQKLQMRHNLKIGLYIIEILSVIIILVILMFFL